VPPFETKAMANQYSANFFPFLSATGQVERWQCLLLHPGFSHSLPGIYATIYIPVFLDNQGRGVLSSTTLFLFLSAAGQVER
jgi:hypothetical protein